MKKLKKNKHGILQTENIAYCSECKTKLENYGDFFSKKPIIEAYGLVDDIECPNCGKIIEIWPEIEWNTCLLVENKNRS